MDLARLALRFGMIDRTAVFHVDRTTPESDTDHTVMLGWAACALAARCFPDLDLGLVAQMALVHDAPELYAGDTPTLRIDTAGLIAKAAREAAAVEYLAEQFDGRLAWFPDTIRLYEAQELPEARFVRGLDKVLPKIVHLLDGGVGLRALGVGRRELARRCEQQQREVHEYAGEFAALMDLLRLFTRRVLTSVELASEVEIECSGSESGPETTPRRNR